MTLLPFTPPSPPPGSPRPSASAGPRRWLHITAMLAGLALLAWCLGRAFGPANREQLARLREAPAGLVALLMGCSLLLLLINAAGFWCSLRPVHRLSMARMQAVNAVANFLAYAPFKLSIVFRVYIHHRRDGLPLLTIAAWFAAFTTAMMAAVLPVLLVTLARPRFDALWFLWTALGVSASYACVLITARWVGRHGDHPLFTRWSAWTRDRPIAAAAKMLSDPRSLAATMALRLADTTTLALRFIIAGLVLGVPIAPHGAVTLAVAHFIIGVASPSGAVGLREAGVSVLARQLHLTGTQGLEVAVLLILASEAVVYALAAAAGALVLKPWAARNSPAHAIIEPDAPGPGPDQPDRR